MTSSDWRFFKHIIWINVLWCFSCRTSRIHPTR